VWSPTASCVVRSHAGTRISGDRIAPEEFEHAILSVLRDGHGFGRAQLANEVRSVFGYTTIAWWRSRLLAGEDARFVPVHVQREAPHVEIVVGDVVVRVPAGAEAAATARLVRAIASC